MKKSTIFKILTLFLTFVIFSCCSGCLTLYFNHKRLQDALELEKQRKEQADALIPEIEGYTFEARPTSYFSSREDWESQGFFEGNDFFEKYQGDEYIVDAIECEDGFKKFIIKGRYDSNDSNESEKYVIICSEREQKYGSIFPVFSYYTCIIYNGEWFIARRMEMVKAGTQREGSRIYALFLVDFEKHEMYYVGYSKGWIEAELNDNKLYSYINICFKFTKNKG